MIVSRPFSMFVCGGLIVAQIGCSSARKTEPTPFTEHKFLQPPVEGPPPVLVAEPDYIRRENEKALKTLVQDARLLMARGRVLFEQGEFDEARLYFDEALFVLTESGFDFETNPELEHAYYSTSSEIQRLEMLLLADFEDSWLASLDELEEPSPLDEIGSVNLYSITVDPALEDRVSQDLKETQFDFPIMVNQEVLKFLDYYQGRGRKAMEEALARSGQYVERFRKIFEEEGVPQDLVYMAHVESLFKPRAYSRAKARGIWQFVAGTARLYDLDVNWWLDERLDVFKATRSAARHLSDLRNEFNDWYLALAAYNGGPGRVTRVFRRHGKMDYWKMARRNLLPRETRNYVPSILAAIIIYRHPEKYGFLVEPDPPLEFETVALEDQFDLGLIAESLDLTRDEMADMNPELLRGVTPPNPQEYRLKIPPGTGEQLTRKLAQIPADQRIRLQHHRVRRGETLSHISARYGVPIRAIAETNRIRNINRLSLGQDLIIPLSYSTSRTGHGVLLDPTAESYTVRQGDSLYTIARAYGLKLQDLFRWNGLGPKDVIHPGQEIRLSQPGSPRGFKGSGD